MIREHKATATFPPLFGVDLYVDAFPTGLVDNLKLLDLPRLSACAYEGSVVNSALPETNPGTNLGTNPGTNIGPNIRPNSRHHRAPVLWEI